MNEPNFHVIVNFESVFRTENRTNPQAGPIDSKSLPKDEHTKSSVIVKTFKKEIQIPQKADQKKDTPPKVEDANKSEQMNQYKPMGLKC